MILNMLRAKNFQPLEKKESLLDKVNWQTSLA